MVQGAHFENHCSVKWEETAKERRDSLRYIHYWSQVETGGCKAAGTLSLVSCPERSLTRPQHQRHFSPEMKEGNSI